MSAFNIDLEISIVVYEIQTIQIFVIVKGECR